MKSKNPFVSFDRYCIRTPSLPFGFLEDLLEAYDIETSLKKALKSTLIREAIFLASPDLYSQLGLWENDAIKDLKKRERIKYSLLKYLTRMSSRCTPFGLFAGVAVGHSGSETAIELSSSENHCRITRYDMHFLVALAQNLAKRKHVKGQLKYYPNSTLYRLGDRYRYVEYTYEDKKRVHSVESVLHSEYLETILEKTKTGQLISDITDYLAGEGFEQADAVDFINALIDNQILVSELEPTVTGEDYLTILKQKLGALDNCANELALLETLDDFQKKLSGTDFKDSYVHKSINSRVSSLKIDFEPQYLFQTDLYPKFNYNQLNHRILRKVKLGLWVLNKISHQQKDPHLEQFKTAFNKRWEHQKIPLLKVLDIESGIGYGNRQVEATPFLDDIQLPIKKTEGKSELNPFQELLFEKLHCCIAEGKQTIELTMDDLNDFEEDWNNAPDTLSVMVEIVVQNQREKVIMNSTGAHAARLLGRFATKDNETGSLVKEIALKEKELNKEDILAEIVHIPESRTGNILRRPHIREHEIPCLGRSNLPYNQQLALQDILVSVDYGIVKLTHEPTGKNILPRLSNAHNYIYNQLPAYQFLCDLQYQDKQGYSFDWGSFMNEMPFLPRVSFKDIILSRARWKISPIQTKKLIKNLSVINETKMLKEEMNSWRQELKVPERVQLVEGDNTLFIDFNSNWPTLLLLENIKHKDSFVLQEVLEDDKPLIRSGGDSYKNEFVFSFYNNQKALLN